MLVAAKQLHIGHTRKLCMKLAVYELILSVPTLLLSSLTYDTYAPGTSCSRFVSSSLH